MTALADSFTTLADDPAVAADAVEVHPTSLMLVAALGTAFFRPDDGSRLPVPAGAPQPATQIDVTSPPAGTHETVWLLWWSLGKAFNRER